jgi:hypothetical protein
MLNKRYQVLLSSWMEDYLKFIIDRYDLNSSSAIRIHMCLGILYIISNLDPDYKIDLQSEDLIAFSKKASKNEMTEDVGHQLFSKIVFETRKAVEHRLSKEKKTIR